MTHDSSSLSRSAGDGPDDVYFVRELDSLGFAVELVKVSVVNTEDVARAIYLATNLKGILQTSMVLCDEAFLRMAYGEWGMAILPEVRGTWDLHDIACQASIKLDFFVRLSSMTGSTGLAGQSKIRERYHLPRLLCAVQDCFWAACLLY
ncbi:hypothetical protein M431DRAFT_502195 [Trichoderma harzianum CBS 226.95]|uniref:Ketoreductase (KR) domain-containing protein n=1 Tax=Trichoderma harzianum CBS 226.95 TaxID=983964 RepID=A0A2T4ASK0_TRIHA|nr:hypothetical protein M431DRAFT_502195 [Trichoderma harzianum CBS 226.95]PTB60054.1 hypothetical protein M431DRAFT_502195 [Trichoderma harzianum CBS 226.95]